jgi:uncharacterized protein Yka (UPF0111/DUF47 family)
MVLLGLAKNQTMTTKEPPRFGRRLEVTTQQYLDQISNCVGGLPEIIRAYEAGTDYQSVSTRIQRLESACDRTKLELGRLVTSADGKDLGVRLTWVHRHADRMLELYGHLDTIANVAEQFAEELIAITPKRQTECLDGLARMSELAVAAMSDLAHVIEEFLHALCRPKYEPSITEGVSTIRAIEGESDTVRNRVLEAAFDDEHDSDAVAYRQLAVLLDGVLDTMEDVTDQIHLMTGLEGWFDVEIYPEVRY